MKFTVPIILLAVKAVAFPAIAKKADIPPSLRIETLKPRQQGQSGQACPYNPPWNDVPAVLYNPQFPYAGAVNGLPSSGRGGYQVCRIPLSSLQCL